MDYAMFSWEYVPELDDMILPYAPDGSGVEFDVRSNGEVCAVVFFHSGNGGLVHLPDDARAAAVAIVQDLYSGIEPLDYPRAYFSPWNNDRGVETWERQGYEGP